jgi:hypothetical protein
VLCDVLLCLVMMAVNVWPLKLAFQLPVCDFALQLAMPMHPTYPKPCYCVTAFPTPAFDF